MRRATSETYDLARRLLAREGGDSRNPEEVVSSAGRVVQKLGEQLGVLVGSGGFRSLLARAVNLAAAEAPLLRSIHGEMLKEDSLQGIGPDLPTRDAVEVKEAMVEVVTNLLWLLVSFIGYNLALRVVRQAWPDIPTGDWHSGSAEVGR